MAFIIVVALLLGISGIGFLYNLSITNRKVFSENNTAVLPEKSIDWSGYKKVGQEFAALFHGDQNNELNSASFNNRWKKNDFIGREIDSQVLEIQHIFNTEVSLKLKDLNSKIAAYNDDLNLEFNARIQEKYQLLNNAFLTDVQDKSKELEAGLDSYRRGLEAEWQLSLLSLQLKLSLAELSSNFGDNKATKEQILAEITQIRQNIASKHLAKEKESAAALAVYRKLRLEHFETEFNSFKLLQLQQLQAQVDAYRVGLERQYELWRIQRESDVDRAIKLRQDQVNPNLTP